MTARKKPETVTDGPPWPLVPCVSCGRLVFKADTDHHMHITLDTSARTYREQDGVAVTVPGVYAPHFVACTGAKPKRERRVT